MHHRTRALTYPHVPMRTDSKLVTGEQRFERLGLARRALAVLGSFAMVAVTVVGFAVPVAAQTEEFVEIPTQIEVGESGAAVLFGIVNPGDGTLDILSLIHI